jgi:NAD(P)-dependent dehydrogenase (short-subunit alcohol dehydrogenase family)
MTVALVTGASRGLGRALAQCLAEGGWSLVIGGRDTASLGRTVADLRPRLADGARLAAVPGDVADADHRRALAAAAAATGGLDLLVNNASTLGPAPLPDLTVYPLDGLRRALEVNVVAALGLVQEVAALLRRSSHPAVLTITSDASVEPYRGWGGYGLSKAAVDHLSAVLAVEEPSWAVWALDPGDMRTDMHQEAFPGEDISDRPPPEAVAPDIARLIRLRLPSGRYRAADVPSTADEARR